MKIDDIIKLKGRRKITMLTAYDYPTAGIVDKAGIDIIRSEERRVGKECRL